MRVTMATLARPAGLNPVAGGRGGRPLRSGRRPRLLLMIALFAPAARASAQGQVTCLRTFHDPDRYTVQLEFDSNGERLYSLGVGGGRVLVWDPAAGKLLRELHPTDERRAGKI